MIKIVELIIVATLLIFSFLAGVKYSDSVKSHVSWLFENKEEEIELPDLSNENAIELNTTGENQDEVGKIDPSMPNQDPNVVDPNQPSPAPVGEPIIDNKNIDQQPKVVNEPKK